MKRSRFEISRNAILGLGLAMMGAAAVARAADTSTDSRYLWDTRVTLQADVHIFEDGFDDGKPEFISRYSPLRGYDGDDFPGYFIDVSSLKLSLRDTSTGRDVFGFERNSLAYFNQKNALFIDPEPFRLELGHSLYRSQKIKPDHKPDPAAAAQLMFSQFNDDSRGRDDYYVQRNDFGAALTLRPSALGHDGSQLGNIDLFYDRSDRDSVRFFDYVTTARLRTGGAAGDFIRWRGVDQKLIEDVNRGGLGLSMSPFQWINVYYEISVEKYENTLSNDALGEVPGLPTSAADPFRFRDQPNKELWQLNDVALGFVPSTTKLVNQVKFDKPIGRGRLNFGYANVILDQDEFTQFASSRGYEQGQIINHTAFGNWTMPLCTFAAWNAHIHYRLRDNNSTFPALYPTNTAPNGTSLLDFLNPLLDGDAHGGVAPPFIQQIETVKFGTDFSFLFPLAASRIAIGWEREDTSRDLVWGNPPPGIRRTIDPNESTLHPDSVNDTFFLKYSARPASNFRVRWNNSVTLGDELGLITEAETGVKSRVGLSYSMPKLRKGASVDVFYQVRYQGNDEFTLTSLTLTNSLLSTATQEREQLFQSAGLTFTILPSEKWANYAGYVWHRDRLEANYLRTSARRYENNWTYLLPIDESRYLTDAHTAFLGASYQFSERWSGNVDYSVTVIQGNLGTGEIETALGNDNELDNVTHRIATGLNYQVNSGWSIGTHYAYAVYRDAVDQRLNGGYHTIGLLASLRF